jgi:C4-dicarboxylate-specific signal transduction histidine kinase
MTSIRLHPTSGHLIDGSPPGTEPVDVNEVALASMQILHGELNDHRVKADVQLAAELPLIMGQRVQLQEVFVNLVNAIALRLNQRPRKTLGFQTPADRLQAVLH